MRTILSKFLEILGKQEFNELTLEEKGMYACVWYDLVGGHMSEILKFNTLDLQFFFRYLAFLGKQSYAVLSDVERYKLEDSFVCLLNAFSDLIQIHNSKDWYSIDSVVFITLLKYSAENKGTCEVLNWSYDKYSSFINWLNENPDKYDILVNEDTVQLDSVIKTWKELV